MSPPVPSDPEVVKRQARDLLHGLRRRDTVALRRYYAIDPLADTFGSRISDAQYIIAREYGFASWQKLMESMHNNGRAGAASAGS